MPHQKKVLAIVLAGGEGNRLMPLTADRAKPGVPFAGSYRLIDFALSNLVNSRYLQIVVLTQYKSHSLDRHISETWRMSTQLGNYMASVPAQQRVGKSWFLGSANAIYQSLNLIHDANPDIVVVVGADHVYRMDFSQMVDAARRQRGQGHGRRRPPAAAHGGPVRRDRNGRGQPGEDRRLRREAVLHAGPRGRPQPVPGLHGQLRLRRRCPCRSPARRRRAPRHQARHGRGHHSLLRRPGRGRRLRLHP